MRSILHRQLARSLPSLAPRLAATSAFAPVLTATPSTRNSVWTSAVASKRSDAMDALFKAKKEKGLSFADLAKSVGKDEVFVASLFYAQNRAETGDVAALSDALGVPKETLSVLAEEFPDKGQIAPMPPTDPLIYRFYEIVLVYGTTLKAVIHEKFGDGIMSAIDFKMTVDKEKWNGSDYVKVTLLGKFLPYRKW